MRYLQIKQLLDPFWDQLRSSILGRLRNEQILRTRTTGKLKSADQLRFIPEDFLDDHGDPLFKDLDDELYLSERYSKEDRPILEAIGVVTLAPSEMLERISVDLEAESSKMKDPETDQKWHTRSARFLLKALKGGRHHQKVRSLGLLPLQSKEWTSIESGDVFHPKIDDADVPMHLDFRLLTAEACSNPTRRAFFEKLGMKTCNPEVVIERIARRYSKWDNFSLTASLADLKFLYCHYDTENGPINKFIVLFNTGGKPVFRIRVTHGREDIIVNDLYFETEDKFGVQKVCAIQPEGDCVRKSRTIHLLHPSYLKGTDLNSYRHDLSWKNWLEKYAEVLSYPRLVSRFNPSKLSKLFQWIIENRKSMVLGILRTHWEKYHDQMQPDIVDKLRETLVPCINSDDVCLKDALIPLPELLKLGQDLGVKDRLPFLKFPSEFEKGKFDDWLFLEKLGPSASVDFQFYLKALLALKENRVDWRGDDRECVLKIYREMERRASRDDNSVW